MFQYLGSTKYLLNKPKYKYRIHWSDGTDIILQLQYNNSAMVKQPEKCTNVHLSVNFLI